MLEGVILKELNKNLDSRGWLAECFRSDELNMLHLPVMSYVSMTLPQISRGPHEHLFQTDYFCFFNSLFKVHLWDNQKTSKTYGHESIFYLGEANPAILIVSPGIIHGYKNVGDKEGLVLNFPNKLYRGLGKKESVDEIRHEDLIPKKVI